MSSVVVSVIIPVYNIEEYVEESLKSILSQSFNFDSIEILLIDDGSTDSSGSICKAYSERFPERIKYIRQNNLGVSAARNAGLGIARGDYVHFFDGDDLISKNFYEKTVQFLECNKDIDFVASKLKFFDEIIDAHPLNYKFSKKRIIDVNKEPYNPILHVISCVFRRGALSGIIFDERLSIAEDVRFISDLLVRTGRYGVLSETVYHYRKRTTSVSAIGGKENNKNYYLAVPMYAYRQIFETWQKSKNSNLWAEYTLLYDISYRLNQKTQSVLVKREEDEYKRLIKSILSSCSDEAIALNGFMSLHQKMYALDCKYGTTSQQYIRVDSGGVHLGGYTMHTYGSAKISLDFLTQNKDALYKAEGRIEGVFMGASAKSYLVAAGTEYELRYVDRVQFEESFLGDVYNDGGAFEVDFLFPVNSSIHFIVKTDDAVVHRMRLYTGSFTRLGALKLTYRKDNERFIKKETHALVSVPYSRRAHIWLESRMILQILANWRLNTARVQLRKLRSRNLAHLSTKARLLELAKPFLFITEAIYMIPRALFLRTSYYVVKRKKKRPIWIVSDRAMAGGDNGEAFFRYLMARKNVPADVYFAISKHSKDYSRVRKIGPVLRHGSVKHMLLHLLADKVISSQADVETTNPFIRQIDHYIDLMSFQFIFLQHGVIRHDLSDWLNRFNKNIGLFVVSAKKEYSSIFSNPYYYGKQNIVLCGLPRYDRLVSDSRKKIILAPTYRKHLARMKTDKNGARRYDPLFRTTEYRFFYNRFINDNRLRVAMKNHGVTGEFYLHPAFSAQVTDFDTNDDFRVMDFPYDYNKAFREGSLMISDHSSVMFDFAYLRKPVLYAHFDVDTFFEGHTYKKSDFFSDRDDGFGEVCKDYDSLLDETVALIEKGFLLSDEYHKRIDDFFEFNDSHNSKRLYDAIMESE